MIHGENTSPPLIKISTIPAPAAVTAIRRTNIFTASEPCSERPVIPNLAPHTTNPTTAARIVRYPKLPCNTPAAPDRLQIRRSRGTRQLRPRQIRHLRRRNVQPKRPQRLQNRRRRIRRRLPHLIQKTIRHLRRDRASDAAGKAGDVIDFAHQDTPAQGTKPASDGAEATVTNRAGPACGTARQSPAYHCIETVSCG